MQVTVTVTLDSVNMWSLMEGIFANMISWFWVSRIMGRYCCVGELVTHGGVVTLSQPEICYSHPRTANLIVSMCFRKQHFYIGTDSFNSVGIHREKTHISALNMSVP